MGTPHLATWTLMVQGDSKIVVDAVSGCSACDASGRRALRDRTLALCRGLLHAGLRPVSGQDTFFLWVDRARNAEADALANKVLDDAGVAFLEEVDASEWLSMACLRDVALEVGFDGASRGNPGPASAGFWVRAYCGHDYCMVLRGGFPVGEATNNEFEMSSVYIVLHLLAKRLGLAGS